MGKRSKFERIDKDFYPTPFKAVEPLTRHLPDLISYSEPCCGEGDLIRHLSHYGYDCVYATDILYYNDALNYKARNEDYIITNPPWTREIMHPMIERFSSQKPTWLLFDLDWAATAQAKPYLEWCRKIQIVGRVKWIEGSKHVGKDNSAWYLFDQTGVFTGDTIFYGK